MLNFLLLAISVSAWLVLARAFVEHAGASLPDADDVSALQTKAAVIVIASDSHDRTSSGDVRMLQTARLVEQSSKRVHGGQIDLGSGEPNAHDQLLPLKDVQDAAKDLPVEALMYPFAWPHGLAVTRNAVASYLSSAFALQSSEASESVQVHADELAMTYGTEGALTAICENYFEDGDVVILAELSYFGAFSGCSKKIKYVGTPLDDMGMSIDGLNDTVRAQKAAGSIVKAVYIIATLQNPTQGILPSSSRQQLVHLARQHNFLIVSDEEKQLFTYTSSQAVPPSMRFFDVEEKGSMGHVICTMSVSGIYDAPGLSVGWLFANRARISNISLGYSKTEAPPISQGLLAELMNREYFSRTKAALMTTLKSRAEKVRSALKSLPSGSSVAGCTVGGGYMWVCLPTRYNATHAFSQTQNQLVASISVALASKFRAQGQSQSRSYDNCFRLSILHLQEAELMQGVHRLLDLIQDISLFLAAAT
eukprot:TRINITY_DN46106_c0_g1_i1.p1 TRINITY_DN46106_c0_g1~~TRINITY_DN46106_c0_g1_i1.p1  ORF type:complete len:488 (+),score=52.88 TRINITY_DN46106_c0_g1_i1:30-1466(+)